MRRNCACVTSFVAIQKPLPIVTLPTGRSAGVSSLEPIANEPAGMYASSSFSPPNVRGVRPPCIVFARAASNGQLGTLTVDGAAGVRALPGGTNFSVPGT